jgi:hypothetical protein
MIRADAGNAHQPLATGILTRNSLDLARQTLDPLVEPAPVASQILDDPNHAGRQDIRGCSQDARQLGAQEALSLPHSNAALQQEGADLIDDAGALTDQPLSHPVQRLQIELIGGLRRHELHRWPLHRFGNRLRVAEVVLLSLRVWPHVLRRHQPGIVTKHLKPATEMMRTDTSLHADQARWHVGKPCLDLATRPLLTQRNCTALIEAYDVERVLADIDADHGNCAVEILRHGVLLVFGAPCQLQSLAGQEHGRTIPLADI